MVTGARISQNDFGFCFQTGNRIACSPDLHNSNGETRVLADNADSNFSFADEDGTVNDFQDRVVKLESVRAFPLPGTLALLGLSLVGAGFLRRKTA